ncbi:MAG: hypothetical protein WCF88_16150 [Candidatus Acidiferrales bacterium]|jgi:hypothetical protein
MKHHKNSRDAASPAPPSQQQTPIAAAFPPAPRQQAPFSARRNSAPTLSAAPQTSLGAEVLRTPALEIAQFLINGPAIRNHRKQLKTIIITNF